VYRELAQLGSIALGGVAAELLARHASCSVLEELKSFSELRLTASTLQADLAHGRWPLDRASYEFYSKQLERWAPSEPESETRRQDAVAFSAAVELLWEQSQETAGRRNPFEGF
jgi:hypothetical protein